MFPSPRLNLLLINFACTSRDPFTVEYVTAAVSDAIRAFKDLHQNCRAYRVTLMVSFCTIQLLCIHIRALFQLPPFKIPSVMFVLRVITAKRVMLRCKV